MADIFISYRRRDSAAVAGRLYDRLSEAFGEEHVFMDIEDISAGQNFVKQLGDMLDLCNVMLILIGPQWLDEENEQGGRRIDDNQDFVYQEVLAGLTREISVIPVLIDGARVPGNDQLPPALSALSLRQALKIYPDRFHADVDRLIAAIKRSQRDAMPGLRWQKPASIAALAMAAIIVLATIFNTGTPVALRTEPGQLSIDQVRAMLVTNKLFDSRWNPSAAGIEHTYEQLVLDGVVVVIDYTTGLMWQKGTSTQQTYERNLTTLMALNESKHGGFNDWRFPTLDEVASLVQPDENQRISPVFEAGTPILMTADRSPEGGLWIVYIFDQSTSPEPAGFNASLKAVRSLP